MADDWSPKSREDWVGLFADGVTAAFSKRDEEQAKAQAAAAEEAAKAAKGDGDKTESDKPSFRERLLGL